MATEPIDSLTKAGEALDSDLKSSLDQHLDQLAKDVWPTSPYILRMPYQQDIPRPKSPSQRNWEVGTPFAREEEELQYLTFFQFPGGMLRSVGQWDDGKGGFATAEPIQGISSSGRTPLQGSSSKKKMTLSEWRNREKGTPTTRDDTVSQKIDVSIDGSKTGNIEGPRQVKDLGKQDVVVDEHKASSDAPNPERHLPQTNPSVKRKRSVSPSAHSVSTRDETLSKPSVKKHRPQQPASSQTSNDSDTHPSQPLQASKQTQHQITNTTQSSAITNHTHPVKPPKDPVEQLPKSSSKSKSASVPKLVSPTLPGALNYKLPPLLSPTLPAEIEEHLAELQRHRPSARQRSDPNSRRGRAGSSPNASEKRPKSNGETGRIERRLKDDESGTRNAKEPSQWVVLRISKGKLAKLFRSASKGVAKSQNGQVNRADTGSQPTGSQPRPSSRASVLDKVRSTEAFRNSTKGTNGSHTPATPAALGSSPPGPNTPNGRDVRVSANAATSSMRRGGSSQGAATGSLPYNHTATPNSPLRPGAREEYQAESERLSRLGRDLKHESDKYIKRDQSSLEERHRALVLATESCLAFMLAGATGDEPLRRDGMAGAKGALWSSVLPYLAQTTSTAEAFPHLQGLLSQLEAVIRDTLVYQINFKLGGFWRDGAPPNEGQQKHLRDLTEQTSKARKAWNKGQAKLWTPELMKSFPKSWAKARTNPSRGKGSDGVVLGNFSVDGFALPMTVSTTGVEAVNAGMSILTEYCEREKVRWKAKLVI